MTHTYVYRKCTACGTCLLADSESCWYCGGEEIEDKQVEWTVPEPEPTN